MFTPFTPSFRPLISLFMHKNFNNAWLCALCVTILATGYSQADDTLTKSFTEAKSMLKESKRSQSRIDKTIADTQSLQQEYNIVSSALQETNINLLHKKKQHTIQLAQIDDLKAQLAKISTTENSLIPMLLELIDWLEQHLSNDLPFHLQERQSRIKQLKENALNPDYSISQLYHSVLEAYQLENEYGYSIDTYKQKIKLETGELESQILRVGRVGLYYLSLDTTHGGYWSQQNKQWIRVEKSKTKQIAHGIKVANKQAPPSLFTLPIEVAGN